MLDNLNRVKSLNDHPVKDGMVVYWMGRDQRARDNWALLYAQGVAIERKQPLVVFFGMPAEFVDSGWRQYDFAIKSLQETENYLAQKNIPMVVVPGWPGQVAAEFVIKQKAGLVVVDFNPMHYVLAEQNKLAQQIDIAMHLVDAHNIVPTWVSSPKLEFAAYTFRPKIHKLLPQYLTDFPELKNHKFNIELNLPKNNWKQIIKTITADRLVDPVDWIVPGEKAAQAQLKKFVTEAYSNYSELRNDPNAEVQSNLSPYLHFGQIAPQRVALVVSQLPPSTQQEDFLEELIVRRELSDNFCYYNPNYDKFEGFPDWAKKTLNEHRSDAREYVYSYQQFEQGKTHDELWNAAQLQMVYQGKMHGYMRMYWAKKILEWTPDPETALNYAIKLNDKYELDGRDPNGYVGCAWSIGGVHDRAWFEREIFGKIRFMNYNGAKRKFDVQKYIDAVASLSGQTLF
ncbi:MAG: deoxyribodipyrimidine photo-lyase [Candidatus Doudnabacteria bacterium]